MYMIDLSLVCDDTSTGLWGLIDPGIAPNLMFYSYIPIVFVAIFFSLFVFIKNRDTLSKFLLVISITFAFWTLFEILNWIAIPASIVAFTWQMQFLVIPLLSFFTFLFFFNFLLKKQPSFKQYIILSLIFLPIILLLPTNLNFLAFDLYDFCGNVDGVGWLYVYFFELLMIALVLSFGIKEIIKKQQKIRKIKNLLITLATFSFLTIFFITTTFADLNYLYEFNLFGPLGLLFFIIIMSYSIAKYRLFNLKVLNAQFLIIVLVFGNFSLLFIQNINNVRIVTLVTLVIVIVVGYMLVKSIKMIDSQREQLILANKNQESLMHFISHQVKGYLTKSRNIFDAILNGDYGPINPKIKEVSQHGFDSQTSGVKTIQNLLKASNLKNGSMEFKKINFDLKLIIEDLIKEFKSKAAAKGLKLNIDLPNKSVMINGDVLSLKEVFKNLIDNALIYTQKGEIDIKLEETDNSIIFSIKDTGVGISKEDMDHLFEEGVKGKDSLKYNIDTSGYGLFIAKQIVNKHNGVIYVKSEGKDKGSEFIVELPCNV
jgi:signal transduction histidine kinase